MPLSKRGLTVAAVGPSLQPHQAGSALGGHWDQAAVSEASCLCKRSLSPPTPIITPRSSCQEVSGLLPLTHPRRAAQLRAGLLPAGSAGGLGRAWCPGLLCTHGMQIEGLRWREQRGPCGLGPV